MLETNRGSITTFKMALGIKFGLATFILSLFTLFIFKNPLNTLIGKDSNTILLLLVPFLITGIIFALIYAIIDKQLTKRISSEKASNISLSPKSGNRVIFPIASFDRIQFEIKTANKDFAIRGNLPRESVKLSPSKESYLIENTITTDSKLFHMTQTDYDKSYTLYLKPESFKALPNF